jgi:hypothetical protein
MKDNYLCLKMLQTLRFQEEIVLYGNLLSIEEEEKEAIITFLRTEYLQESLDFPYQAPLFDKEAALWAAKTIYIAAQLILYRQHAPKDLDELLPDYQGIMSPAAILSADLCLRFLPDMLVQLKLIDFDDKLIPILEKFLTKWHYSGIQYPLDIEKLYFETIEKDFCVKQMYTNRVLFYKKEHLMNHHALRELISANLGLYKDVLL